MTNLSSNLQWTLNSATVVQPSFWIQVSAAPQSPYILDLCQITDRIQRGEPAQMGALQPAVEAALVSPAEKISVRAWAKRLAPYLAKR